MKKKQTFTAAGGGFTAPALRPPVFTAEGPQFYAQAYKRNKQWAVPSATYQTPLAPRDEAQFRHWVAAKGVPFNPNARITDYDMRGYWLAQHKAGAPAWNGGHFPDTYKTPYDTTFSRESIYATKNNPLTWAGQALVNRLTGRVVFKPR